MLNFKTLTSSKTMTFFRDFAPFQGVRREFILVFIKHRLQI